MAGRERPRTHSLRWRIAITVSVEALLAVHVALFGNKLHFWNHLDGRRPFAQLLGVFSPVFLLATTLSASVKARRSRNGGAEAATRHSRSAR